MNLPFGAKSTCLSTRMDAYFLLFDTKTIKMKWFQTLWAHRLILQWQRCEITIKPIMFILFARRTGFRCAGVGKSVYNFSGWNHHWIQPEISIEIVERKIWFKSVCGMKMYVFQTVSIQVLTGFKRNVLSRQNWKKQQKNPEIWAKLEFAVGLALMVNSPLFYRLNYARIALLIIYLIKSYFKCFLCFWKILYKYWKTVLPNHSRSANQAVQG